MTVQTQLGGFERIDVNSPVMSQVQLSHLEVETKGVYFEACEVYATVQIDWNGE